MIKEDYSSGIRAISFRILALIAFTVFTIGVRAELVCELSLAECVDYTGSGINVTVPENTARIAQSPMSVCLEGSTEKQPVDIVFAVDMSSSMYGHRNCIGCPRDPDFLTPKAVKNSVNFLQTELGTMAASVNAGFLGFSHGVCNGNPKSGGCVDYGAGPACQNVQSTLVPPASLTINAALIDAQTDYNANNYFFNCGRLGDNTEYDDALRTAGNWLGALTSPNKKVIIFLTDGEPNNGTLSDRVSSFVEAHDDTNFPAVFALFINPRTNGNGYRNLRELANKTGGAIYELQSANEVNSIMQSIISKVITFNPLTTAVINNTNSQQGTATQHTASPPPEGKFSFTLDRTVALVSKSANAVNFSTQVQSSPNLQSVLANIAVTGPLRNVTTTSRISGSPFNITCAKEEVDIIFFDPESNKVVAGEYDFRKPEIGLTLDTDKDLKPAQPLKVKVGGKTITVTTNAQLKAIVKSSQRVGDTISASWTDPENGKTYTNSIVLGDPRQEQASITFKDINGNPISGSLNALDNDQFILELKFNKHYLGESFPVDLSTDGGDKLQVTVTKVPGTDTYQSKVNFNFTQEINANDQIISGLLIPNQSPVKAVVTAVFTSPSGSRFTGNLPIQLGYNAAASEIYIIDGNKDGRADSIFIVYPEAIKRVPQTITEIHWPDNEGKGKNAGVDGKNKISQVNSNTIVIDLSKDQFAYGETGPSATDPPTMTLENNVKVQIGDKVAPMVVSVEKAPSSGAYIEESGGTQVVKVFPDTLKITLSEPIKPTVPGASLNSLFSYIPGGSQEGTPVPLPVQGATTVSDDGLTITVLIPHEPDGNTLLGSGDYVQMNPDAPFADAANNTPSNIAVKTEGADYTGRGSLVHLLQPVLSLNNKERKSSVKTGDKQTVPVMTRNGTFLRNETMEVELNQLEWIPPVGLTETGTVDNKVQNACNESSVDNQDWVSLNPGCLSIVQVSTKGPFKAQVSIYDNLGKSVHASTQQFGYCGELKNQQRISNGGLYIAPLIWNQRDDQTGSLVGSGVYIWKIRLKYKSGKNEIAYKKQGIARSKSTPERGCAK